MRWFKIAFKLLWKQKVMTLLLLTEILLSVIAFSELSVHILEDINNKRAVSELPTEHVYILSLFEYYDSNYAIDILEKETVIKDIGTAYYGGRVFEGRSASIVAYTKGLLKMYQPKLQSGDMLQIQGSVGDDVVMALATAGMHCSVGSMIHMEGRNRDYTLYICGVLDEPTQYLLPDTRASSEIFSADMLIGQEEGFLICAESIIDCEKEFYMEGINLCSLFIKMDGTAAEVEETLLKISKYGEVTSMEQLIDNYDDNITRMIAASLIIFVLTCALAFGGICNNCMIQLEKNRRYFTIYYLTGMKWKDCAFIEMMRICIILLFSWGLTLCAGKVGMLNTQWILPRDMVIFYTMIACYLLVILSFGSVVFIRKLVKTDLSEQLKQLQSLA